MSGRYSRRGRSSSQPKAVILDTTGFLAKIHLQLPVTIRIYTTPTVIREVRDRENREALEIGLELKRIMVVDPDPQYKALIEDHISRNKKYNGLSQTDRDVAALALKLSREEEITVITDDYLLQELLSRLKIPFKPLRTRGIRLEDA